MRMKNYYFSLHCHRRRVSSSLLGKYNVSARAHTPSLHISTDEYMCRPRRRAVFVTRKKYIFSSLPPRENISTSVTISPAKTANSIISYLGHGRLSKLLFFYSFFHPSPYTHTRAHRREKTAARASSRRS